MSSQSLFGLAADWTPTQSFWNISSKCELFFCFFSSLGSRLQGTEGFGVPQWGAYLLQEGSDLQVLFWLPAIEDDHQREVRLRPTQVVRALDLIVVEVHHLFQRVELSGAVAHHHDDVGPVRERTLARGQRHHGGELLHAFGGFAVWVRVVVAVALEALGAAIVEHQWHVAGVVPADEGADPPVVVRSGAGSQGFHVGRGRLPAEGFVEVEAELGQERCLEALKPRVQVRRLHSLLGLAAKQVFAGLFLPLEQLTPGGQLGFGAVQAKQCWQEAPLRHLSLAAQQLIHHVHLGLETLLRPAQDGVVEPKEETAKGSNATQWKKWLFFNVYLKIWRNYNF